MKVKKVSIKTLQREFNEANSSNFTYPVDYKIKTRFRIKCKCCHHSTYSNRISIFDGKLIYICPKCGCRHFYPLKKITRKKIKRIILALLLSFVGFWAFIIAWGLSFTDDYNTPAQTPTTTQAAETTTVKETETTTLPTTAPKPVYPMLSVGDNEVAFNGSGFYTFVADKWQGGSYIIESYNDEDCDLKISMTRDGYVTEEDDFGPSRNFCLTAWFYQGETVNFKITNMFGDLDTLKIRIIKANDALLRGYSLFEYYYENQITVTNEAKTYYNAHDYSADVYYFNETYDRTPVDFYVDDEACTLWLAFDANCDGVEYTAWYPVKYSMDN